MRLQLSTVRAALLVFVGLLLAPLDVARAQVAPGTEGEKTGTAPPEGAPAKTESASTAPRVSPVVVRGSTEFSSYADTDHVFVQTPTAAVSAESPTAGWSIGGSYLVDVVSAASVDIISTASRRWNEVRQAGTADASYKPGSFGVAVSGDVSSEPDYFSWTAGGSITQDLFEKNATLLLGFSHGHDVAGRSGTPFSVFSHPLDREWLKAGITVLLNRSSVLSVVGDVILENGDQSKPYRYIPMFAPGTSVSLGASADEVAQLRLPMRTLEQLPLTRQRYALSLRYAHRYRSSTLRLDERLYADSWALAATSTDLRFLVDAGRRVETGPHVRLHAQKAVDFWQRAYTVEPGLSFPALRTGDRELGPLLNATGGWTLRFGLGSDETPESWVLGFDVNVTETRYLDDLYITNRISAIGATTLEAQF